MIPFRVKTSYVLKLNCPFSHSQDFFKVPSIQHPEYPILVHSSSPIVRDTNFCKAICDPFENFLASHEENMKAIAEAFELKRNTELKKGRNLLDAISKCVSLFCLI